MKAAPIQTNITSGEISPLMMGRVDVNRYANGAARVENFIVTPQGPIKKRSGTRFVGEVRNSSQKAWLQEFEFSTTQAYTLVFNNGFMQVIKDGAFVETSPGVRYELAIPWSENELDDLSFAQSADVLYVCHPSYQPRKITRTSHTAWTIATLTTKDGPYLPFNSTVTKTMRLSAFTRIEEMRTDINTFTVGDEGDYVEWKEEGEWQLGKIRTGGYSSPTLVFIDRIGVVKTGVSQGDLTYTAPNIISKFNSTFTFHDVGKYVRSSAGTWHLINNTDTPNSTASRATVGAALAPFHSTGAAVVTVTKQGFAANVTASGHTPFVASDVNRQIRLVYGATQLYGVITAYYSSTLVDATFTAQNPPFDPADVAKYYNDARTDLWRLGAWSAATGWPSTVAFHEQRLVFANTTSEPQTIWFSETGIFEEFSPTEEDSSVLDTNGITFTIASKQVNAILWLESGPTLLVGTTGGVWQVKGSTINEPLTPTSISITPQSSFGSAAIRPRRSGHAVMFIQRSKEKLRELTYNFDLDSFVAEDLTVISEHILRDADGAVALAHQQEPRNILWMACTSGTLVGVTYEKAQEVVAWHRHTIGGNGIVESLACIPNSDGSENILYMVVKRTIGAATKRYVERLEAEFWPTSSSDKNNMYFADSFLSYNGAAATTISGLSHLNGLTVRVLADGVKRPDAVVSGGAITISPAASVVQVGLPYDAVLQVLPVEGGSQLGSSQGKIKRITRVTARVLDSLAFSHGPNTSSLTEESFNLGNDDLSESPLLFTGDIQFNLDSSSDLRQQYVIVSSNPYPLTILALMPELQTNERM